MPAPTTATWPGALSERSSALVHGSPRAATVLAAFPAALYLRVGGHADVLPIVTRDGLRLPTALTVATPLSTVGWGTQPGDRVLVGGGTVQLPGVTVRAVRTWRPRRTPSALTGSFAAGWDEVRLPWRATARALVDTMLGGHPAHLLEERVGALVGAGPGLTPSGDDVLCGILLGLRLHGASHLVDTLWQAVQPRLEATTSLSAALLREAADGYAVLPVERLVHAVAARRPGDEVSLAVRGVLEIGHTSGADLLGGLAGCHDVLAPEPRRPALGFATDPARTLPADPARSLP